MTAKRQLIANILKCLLVMMACIIIIILGYYLYNFIGVGAYLVVGFLGGIIGYHLK